MAVAPSRANIARGEAPIVLALTALLTIVSLVPPGGAAAAAGAAALVLTVIAWNRRAAGASSLGLLFVTCLALGLGGIGPQQVVFALAFGVYGLALGALRRHAGGLMAPFITHVLTDVVIVTIVLALVRT